ncbi:MAG: SufE family protein [Oscillospiraceae bacterium]
MTFHEKQAKLVEQVNGLGDCFNQYAYLISCAAALPPLPEELHTEEHLVKGCQSQVWIHLAARADGTLYLQADSDTLILKGILKLFAGLVDGCTPKEIMDDPWDFLEKTELTVTFPSSRTVGISSIVQKIKTDAAALSSC